MKYQTLVTIDNAFRDLIKAHNYEKYVLAIINRSTVIFQNLSFSPVSSQSHGECDFLDSQGQKYDAKLVFDNKQGQLIGDSKNDLLDWLNSMLDEKTEFSESIHKRDLTLVANTKLYRIMKERIKSVETDESAILFIPFPIVDDFQGSVFLQFATDFLQAVYDRLVDDGVVICQDIYFIYPSSKPHIYILRDSNRKREYIRCDELKDFILYEARIVSE